MEKKSKRELLATISEQEERVNRYQTRFTDVVKAYKSLAKEKDALEATVKALATKSPARHHDKVSATDTASTLTISDPLGVASATSPASSSDGTYEEDTSHGLSAESCDASIFQDKIETLSQALATVTEEKSKMEAAYQADKRKTLQHHGNDIDEYCQTIDTLKATVETLEAKLTKSKSKICQEQSERENEQEDHAMMLKEFQTLVSKERADRENAEKRLKEELKSHEELMKQKSDKISELEVELDIVNESLKKVEEHKSQPDGNALKVMEDLYGERQQHEVELTAERRRAIKAEEGLRLLSMSSEKRSTEMEIQISDMASLIGKYEHTHLEDQKKINKLKEQLSLIGDDNRLLANQVHDIHESDARETEAVQRLQQEVFKLKGLLRVMTSKSETTTESDEDHMSSLGDIDELLRNNDTTHHACLMAYRQLKEEYLSLKTKAASADKVDNSTTSSPKELVFLKQRSDTLQKELTDVRDYYDNKEQELSFLVSKLQCDITRLEENHKQELKTAEDNCNEKILLLNEELKKQRCRTVDLLTEKDMELERLTANSPRRIERRRNEFFDNTRQGDDAKDKLAAMETDSNAISSLLTLKPSNGSNGLVHYSQQIDQMGNDLASVRFENEDMKLAIRDTELREEKVLRQMAFLKEEIRKLERDRSRETANLEYLKNVVLQYLLTDTLSVRQQMTNAMATILQFSPSELKQVTKKMTGWWPVT